MTYSKRQALTVSSFFLLSFFFLQSCTRQYVCNCDSSSGEASTTVSATSKRKAEEACAALSYQTPTNDTVTVGVCELHD